MDFICDLWTLSRMLISRQAGNFNTICIIKNWLKAKILSCYNTKQQKESKIYTWNVYLRGYIAQFVCLSPLGFVVCFCVFVCTNQQSLTASSHFNDVLRFKTQYSMCRCFYIDFRGRLSCLKTDGLWICTSKNAGIWHVPYTLTNTHFSYTFIYEHTDKILLTDTDK